MLRSHGAPPRSEALPLVFGCLADPLRRRKVESALRDAADARWFGSFVDLREALETEPRRVVVAVIDMRDPTGASANGFARTMADTYPGIGIVAYRHPRRDSEAEVCQLGASGVHDLLVEGLTDEGYMARETILGACRRGAADMVMHELTKVLPERLVPFAETVVRNPSNSSVEKVTRHLNIHRQTPNSWCKKERFLRPEEVLMWCRLLLVATMLELTSRTLESIAVELDYASATSLRNQLRNYTGMTSREIRAAGLSAVMSVFVGRIAQRRAGLGGIIDPPADNTVIPIRISHAG